MSLERQTIYGWPIAIDLFLGGTGAGAFLIGFLLQTLEIQEPVPAIILAASPLLVVLGMFLLVADITVRRRVYRLFSNLKSWTSRGTWILTFFLITGFNYAMIVSYPAANSWLANPAVQTVVGGVASFFALFVVIYPGFLMGAISAVPFWNTPILPILFLIAGLENSLAFILLISPLFPEGLMGLPELFFIMIGALIMLTATEVLVLRIFLARASRGPAASQESMRLLTASRFREKMFSFGFIIPLCLCLLLMVTDNGLYLYTLSFAAALFFLAGGLYLRYAIIRAGVFLPRFTLEGDAKGDGITNK